AGEEFFAPDAADLGHGALRAPVFIADPEHHGIDKAKGMVEHQALDLAVGGAAPMAANDKGPADLDLAALGLMAVIAAGADQPAARAIDEHKTHFAMERAVKELPEFRLGVAIGSRMHLPDLRIGAGRVQLQPVIGRDRPDGDGRADQGRLEIGLRQWPSLAQSLDRRNQRAREMRLPPPRPYRCATTASLRMPLLR